MLGASSVSKKESNGGLAVRVMVEAAVMIALATILSVIVVYRAPQGGSVTPASMVPLLILALRHGPKVGLMAGSVYGLLQLWIGPFILHWLQVIIDYPLAFAMLGLAGLLPRYPLLSVAVGILGRAVSHVVAGAVFFAHYAPEGTSPWLYSLVYNGSYLVPELVLSLLVVGSLLAGTRRRLLRGMKM